MKIKNWMHKQDCVFTNVNFLQNAVQRKRCETTPLCAVSKGRSAGKGGQVRKRVEVCVPSADRGKQEWQQRTTFLSIREHGCSQRTRVLPENTSAPGDTGLATFHNNREQGCSQRTWVLWGTKDWQRSLITENKGAPGMKDNIPKQQRARVLPGTKGNVS